MQHPPHHPSAHDSGSRSARHTVTSYNSSIHPTKGKALPPHIEEVLHAHRSIELRTRFLTGQGLHTTQNLMPGLDRKLKVLPWDPQAAVKGSKSSDSVHVLSGTKQKTTLGRSNRKTPETIEDKGPSKAVIKLRNLLNKSPHGKITFTNSNEPMEVIPFWVTYRLQDSCRNARFTLPADYRTLEKLKPLEYLERYVVLNHSLTRRYSKLFTTFMEKHEKCLKFDKLYAALNSIFVNSLGEANFKILCIALFINEDFKTRSRQQFAGICCLAERLFWSSYLNSGGENTFFLLGQNRSLLECADFNGLQAKIQDLDVSLEMRALLFSLA